MKIKRIAYTPTDAAQIPTLFDEYSIPFVNVDTVNWKEYPYCPAAQVRLALTSDALLLHYHVNEQAALARYSRDGNAVWTDSCMECFLLGSDARTYYNIECSCIGTLLIGQGEGRSGRKHLSPALLDTISRWSSLGREPFGLRNEPTQWDLCLAIPFTVFGDDSAVFADPTFKGNIYKCGDDLPTPHFLSLFPIPIAEPNFHRPDHFGIFEVE